MKARVCRECRYYRQREPVRPFAAPDILAPGVLKEQGAWEQEERQRAQQEYQAFLAGQPFEYEPHNYAWCAWHSKVDEVALAQSGDEALLDRLRQEGAVVVNAVTGAISPLYVLCAWKNPEGRCEQYESADTS